MKNGTKMKTAFLITAYTGGNFHEKKVEQCIILIKSIREKFPNSFILLCDHFPITKQVQELCDASFFDSDNFNNPHGNGEKSSIIKGLKILQSFDFKNCYKFNYDYNITDKAISEVLKWPDYKKLFLAAQWKRSKDDQLMQSSVCSAFGYWHIETALKIFDDNNILQMHIEQWIYQRINQLGLCENVYIYDNLSDAFGGEYDEIEVFLMGGTDMVYWKK
jgi:hypothetical protein